MQNRSFANLPLENVAVILVEPQSPGNIGMVCRAMANFGAHQLRLVNPCPHLHSEAHRFAVFASDLLGQARVFPSLPDALADLHLTVAATRRRGRLRGNPLAAAEAGRLLPELAEGSQLGLVFGREDAGLTSAEVALCSHSAFIPSLPATGSLNLAQSVLIFLYECFQASAPPATSLATTEPANQGDLEALFRRMEEVLSRIAFLNPARPEARMSQLRQLLRRSKPGREEIGLLRGMWDQIDWSTRDWRGRKRGEGSKTR